MQSQTFGELIRNARMEKGLSLRQAAGRLDFDQSSLSKIERNEMAAPARLIGPLSDMLGLDYRDLQVKYLSEKLFYELMDEDFAPEALAVAQKRLAKEGRGTRFLQKRKKLIRQIEEYLSSKPVEKAWLFGSFSRKEESYDSDIDLLVRFQQPNDLDLFDYVGMRMELEELTGRQVDLVEEGYLIPEAEARVAKEKTLVYERKAG